MNQDSNRSKELPAHAAGRNPVRNTVYHMRTIFIALVLTIGTNQSVLAQDGGTLAGRSNTTMLTSISSREICIGDYGTIRVQIIREQTPITTDGGTQGKPRRTHRMVPVNASITDSSIADLLDTRQEASVDSDTPGQVTFRIKGIKEGDTQVEITTEEMDRLPGETFDDQPGGSFVSNRLTRTVPVKVKNCKYKVDLTSNSIIPGEVNGYFQGSIDAAALEPTEEDAQIYRGLADVKWRIRVSKILDCQFKTQEFTGKAALKGHLDNDGTRLVVNLMFEPMTIKLKAECKSSEESTSGEFEIELKPEELRLAVPTSLGGASTQSHVVNVPVFGSSKGTAFIVVYPSNTVE